MKACECRVPSLLYSPWFYVPTGGQCGVECWVSVASKLGVLFRSMVLLPFKGGSGLYWWSCGNGFAEISSCIAQESPVCSVVYGRFSRFSTVTLLLCFPTHFLVQVLRVRACGLDCFLSASPVKFVSPAKVTVRRRKYRTRFSCSGQDVA